jgi:hypothetical protein
VVGCLLLAALLCLLVVLFDIYTAMFGGVWLPSPSPTGAPATGPPQGGDYLATAKQQRNLYLTLLNIVLTLAISWIYVVCAWLGSSYLLSDCRAKAADCACTHVTAASQPQGRGCRAH